MLRETSGARIVRLVGFASLGIVTLTFAVEIVAQLPSSPSSTVQAFFGASIQVNATLLVAVFLVASFLLPRVPIPIRSWYGYLLSFDASLFFLGLLESAYGFLVPTTFGRDPRVLVGAVLTTWFLGFALLFDFIRVSQRVEK